VAELLGYLVMGGRRSYERAELADHFWSDQDAPRARRCLSTAVWRLRQILEPKGVPPGSYLSTENAEMVGFNWASAHLIDAAELEAVLDATLSIPAEHLTQTEAQGLEDGLALCTGDFLAGVLDTWALRERDRLAARQLDGMAHLLRHKLHTGQYQAALALGARILERDPLREDVHRDMMHLNLRTGQRSRAIQQYHACRALLRQELAIDPAPETERAYKTLCNGTSQDPGTAPEKAMDQAMDRLHRALEELDRARALVEQLTRQQPPPV
jgi:DNA-binding SARP family transcriptional activator